MRTWNSRYTLELEVVDGVNLAVPSHRIPTGLYVSISTPYGQCSTAIKPVMADRSVRWNEPLTIRGRPFMLPRWFMPIFPSTSKAVYLELRASFETAKLGQGELVSRVETTVRELLTNGDRCELQFPVTETGCSSLMLKARRVKLEQPVGPGTIEHSEIDLLTDSAHKAYALYRNSSNDRDLQSAIEEFQAVLNRCPDGHPHRAAALSNLAHVLPHTKIDSAISHFRSALALRPYGHPDHPQSIHNLCKAYHQRYLDFQDHADLRKAMKLYLELLPICPEGSYLQLRVNEEYNALLKNPSDESTIRLPCEPSLRPPDLPAPTTPPLSQRREGELELQRGQVNGIREAEVGQPARPSENLPLSNHYQTQPRTRNVVVFGEPDSGKSSVINAITQSRCAKTSNDAPGCTVCHEKYEINLAGKRLVLFDTVGIDKGTTMTGAASKEVKSLESWMRKLMGPRSDGIDLLVYCVRSVRAKQALIKNYNLMYSTICEKKVPIVVVITGLEDYPENMESWWQRNKEQLHDLGMQFEDHACVTTLPEDPGIPSPTERIRVSCEILCDLILNNCSE